MTEQQPSFGDLLRRFRLVVGLTQEELAERASLSVRGISDLERGIRRPRLHTVRQLADTLNLSTENRQAFLAIPWPDRGDGRAATYQASI